MSVSNKDSSTGEVTIRAECYRSMRKSQKPHSLSVGESYTAGSDLGKVGFIFRHSDFRDQ